MSKVHTIKITWLEAPLKQWLKSIYKQGMDFEEIAALLIKEDIDKFTTRSLIK